MNQKRFAASIIAVKKGERTNFDTSEFHGYTESLIFQHEALAILAISYEEAVGTATIRVQESYPIVEGWYGHHILVAGFKDGEAVNGV